MNVWASFALVKCCLFSATAEKNANSADAQKHHRRGLGNGNVVPGRADTDFINLNVLIIVSDMNTKPIYHRISLGTALCSVCKIPATFPGFCTDCVVRTVNVQVSLVPVTSRGYQLDNKEVCLAGIESPMIPRAPLIKFNSKIAVPVTVSPTRRPGI